MAVLINKAMIEIPPKFAGSPPVSLLHSRQGAQKKELKLSALDSFCLTKYARIFIVQANFFSDLVAEWKFTKHQKRKIRK